jgi:hypothetical protein
MSPLTGPVSLSVGRLASTLGRRDEAEHHFRGGVELCERMEALGFLAIARYELGRLLLPSTEGRTLLEHARHTAEELAMPGWLARIDAARTDPTVRYAGQATTSQRP